MNSHGSLLPSSRFIHSSFSVVNSVTQGIRKYSQNSAVAPIGCIPAKVLLASLKQNFQRNYSTLANKRTLAKPVVERLTYKVHIPLIRYCCFFSFFLERLVKDSQACQELKCLILHCNSWSTTATVNQSGVDWSGVEQSRIEGGRLSTVSSSIKPIYMRVGDDKNRKKTRKLRQQIITRERG